jgi:hypothetical protein
MRRRNLAGLRGKAMDVPVTKIVAHHVDNIGQAIGKTYARDNPYHNEQ